MGTRSIWGHAVGTDARGRSVWPEELKREVARRIVDGQRVCLLVEELGTSQALVQKWWQKLRPDHPRLADPSQTFAEVQLVDGQRSLDLATGVVSSSRFTVNGITLEADRPIAVGELARLLDALARVP